MCSRAQQGMLVSVSGAAHVARVHLSAPAPGCLAAGTRFDLLHNVIQNLVMLFPRRPYYIINMGGAVQSQRQKATHAVLMPLDPSLSVATTVVTGGCRANSYEKIRLRCLDSRCKFRPRGTGEEWGEEEEDVNPDDKDFAEEQLFEEDCDDEEDLHGEATAAPSDSPSKAQSSGLQKRNVFPFANPESFYKRLLGARPN
jgi:hypothetical protein